MHFNLVYLLLVRRRSLFICLINRRVPQGFVIKPKDICSTRRGRTGNKSVLCCAEDQPMIRAWRKGRGKFVSHRISENGILASLKSVVPHLCSAEQVNLRPSVDWLDRLMCPSLEMIDSFLWKYERSRCSCVLYGFKSHL